jgi:hypothetical protein
MYTSRNQFIATISHYYHNPLDLTNYFIELMLENFQYVNPEIAKLGTLIFYNPGNQCSLLISNLMNWSN